MVRFTCAYISLSDLCLGEFAEPFPSVCLSSKPGSENSWVPTVAGLNKRDLLKDVLSVFGSSCFFFLSRPELVRLGFEADSSSSAVAKSKGLAALGSEYQDVLKKMNAA